MFKGKNVLITGSRGGIGRSLVEEFAKNGANIFASLRSPDEEFNKFITDLQKKYSVNIDTLYFDITDTELMKKELKRVFFEQKIPVDILVNNAGVAHGGFFQMTPISKIKEVFEINLFSHMEITQIILKNMIKQKKGSIVNIASISGLDLNEGNCAYGVSKAAVIAWTKTLALETARYNIRVNAVAPSLVDTRMAEQMEDKSGKKMVEDSAMKRLARPEEIAKIVVFLASDETSFINGQTIRIDGGMA